MKAKTKAAALEALVEQHTALCDRLRERRGQAFRMSKSLNTNAAAARAGRPCAKPEAITKHRATLVELTSAIEIMENEERSIVDAIMDIRGPLL